MSEGAVFIISMCAVVSLCSFASYTRTDGKAMRLSLGIILLCSLIRPVSGIISSLDFPGESELIYGELGSEIREEELSQAFTLGIASALMEEFSLDEDSFSVEVSGFDSEKMTCEKCCVRLWGRAALADLWQIESLVLKCGVKKCEVTVSL